MRVITFYSFKGGVGRTMALANVAYEMARSGRTVLMVDFDLEAPGLDTLDFPKRKPVSDGLVEYVIDYLNTGRAPEINKYLYECEGVSSQGGRLWIMPAGRGEYEYGYKLGQIDWDDLYTRRDGYLLFENLKEQWREHLDPDYVLIDSRTGHTDVGGICTRQLPDEVALLFVPNEQNLRGLRTIVRDIRSEKDGLRKKPIDMRFVLSNVPDLDDEEAILATRIRQFREILGIEELETIHRYDSLALLNQAIFTRDRPNSRLCREYKELTRKFFLSNPEDREGALEFLNRLLTRRHTFAAPDRIDGRLRKIRELHANDAEVLFDLANVRRRERRFDEALSLIEKVFELGESTPEVIMARAETRHLTGDNDGAVDDVRALLATPHADMGTISRAVQLLRRIRPGELVELERSPAVNALVPRELEWLAQQLQGSREELGVAKRLVAKLLPFPATRVRGSRPEGALATYVLALIGTSGFREAVNVIDASVNLDEARISMVFNYAMAKWGFDNKPDVGLFRRVMELHQAEESGSPNANYLQCLAVSSWVVGASEDAVMFTTRARHVIMSSRGGEFSCWRYQLASSDEFLADLDDMEKQFGAGTCSPRFLGRTSKELARD